MAVGDFPYRAAFQIDCGRPGGCVRGAFFAGGRDGDLRGKKRLICDPAKCCGQIPVGSKG